MEEPGEDTLGIDERGPSETLTAEQVAAEAVLDGERITVDAVSCLELTLEVGRPDQVGRIERHGGPTWVRPLAAPPSLLHQSSTHEVAVQRPFARNVLIGIEPDEPGANFSGTEDLMSAVADPDCLFDQVGLETAPGQLPGRFERSSRPSGPSRS